MISLIVSILPLMLIAISVLYTAKNGGSKHLNKRLSDLQAGWCCYKCRCESDYGLLSILETGEPRGISLCKNCRRDKRINQLSSRCKIFIDKFSIFLISKKFQTIGNITIFVALFFILLQIILHFFQIKVNLTLVSNSILSIYWILFIIRNRLVLK
jgi:hypothetical protein